MAAGKRTTLPGFFYMFPYIASSSTIKLFTTCITNIHKYTYISILQTTSLHPRAMPSTGENTCPSAYIWDKSSFYIYIIYCICIVIYVQFCEGICLQFFKSLFRFAYNSLCVFAYNPACIFAKKYVNFHIILYLHSCKI